MLLTAWLWVSADEGGQGAQTPQDLAEICMGLVVLCNSVGACVSSLMPTAARPTLLIIGTREMKYINSEQAYNEHITTP